MKENSQALLFIVDYYPPHLGGLETLFLELTQRLSDHYRIGIITTRHQRDIPPYEKKGGIEIWRVGKNRRSFLFQGTLLGYRIAKNFDCIHTTTYAAAIPGKIVSFLHRKPLLLTVHEVFGPLRKICKPRFRWVYRGVEKLIFLLYQRHQNIVTVSHYTKKSLENRYGIPAKNCSVVYNGVNYSIRNAAQRNPTRYTTRKTKHIPANAIVGMYTGHAGCSKGVKELIAALPEIIKNFPRFHLILNLFEGPQRSTYISRIDQGLLETHVHVFSGFSQKKLLSFLGGVDMVFIPSRSEGFGLIAAEVAALGTPIITTKHGALCEVVSGSFVHLASYTAESFCQAIADIIGGKIIQRPLRKFLWEETFQGYQAIYKKLLSE